MKNSVFLSRPFVQPMIVYSGFPQFRIPTTGLGLAGNEVSIFMKRALAPGRRRRIRPRLEEHAKLVSQTMQVLGICIQYILTSLYYIISIHKVYVEWTLLPSIHILCIQKLVISSLSLNGDYYIVFDRELENTFNTFKRRSKNFKLVFAKFVCPLIFRLDFLATARPQITYVSKTKWEMNRAPNQEEDPFNPLYLTI